MARAPQAATAMCSQCVLWSACNVALLTPTWLISSNASSFHRKEASTPGPPGGDTSKTARRAALYSRGQYTAAACTCPPSAQQQGQHEDHVELL